MNAKQFAILIALVVVLGGAALVLHHRQTSSWSDTGTAAGKKLLGDFPVNDVARIQIQQGTNDLNLVKTNDIWCVRERGDYPANFSQISQFLLKLRGLKIVQTEQVGPAQRPRLDLAPPGPETNSATLVAFRDDQGKPIRTLWLGKAHLHESSTPSPNGAAESWPDGRYVLTSSNSETVAVISDALSEVNPQPDQWLDKTFFKVQNPKTISVTFPQATNSWALTRTNESASWELADAKPGEKLDSAKSGELMDALSSPSFNDVAPDAKPAQTGLDKPKIIEIKTFGDFDYRLKIGNETNDNYYMTVAVTGSFPKARTPGKNEKPAEKEKLDKAFQAKLKQEEDKLQQESSLKQWVYLVPNWTINPLLKERSQLLVEKKAEPIKSGIPKSTK